MSKIKRVNLSRQIVEAVLSILKEGNYRIDDRIPTEKELSERLGVSRNSIREAMKALTLAQVLESIPGKGTFLRKNVDYLDMDSDELFSGIKGTTLQELVQVRMIMEVAACELAAERGRAHPEELDVLRRAWERQPKVFSHEPASEMEDPNSGFVVHLAIVEICGNSLLKRLMHSLLDELRMARYIYPVEEADFEEELAYHERIVTAILNGDPQQARIAMQGHLENTEKVYARKESKRLGR